MAAGVKIAIDVWKWPAGSLDQVDIDVTRSVLNYRWQKSIKNPQGSCQLNVVPQIDDTNILDVIRPMDIVKIYEFGQLKFIGFIQRVSYGGSIQGAQGQPSRNATITCQQFGGLFATATVGMGLGVALRSQSGKAEDDPFIKQAQKLQLAIAGAVEDGTSFAELAQLVIKSFQSYLTGIGAKNFTRYVNQYFDASAGLSSKAKPLLPRSFSLYTGTEQSLTLWDVLDQLVERPFNELWVDSGPRKVAIDGNSVTLPEKSCAVFRPTPFNGTVSSGGAGSAFDGIEEVEVPRNYLLAFNLSRSMDEAYTFYSVKEAAFQLSEIARLLNGLAVVDPDRIGKYLFRPLITELFYTRTESLTDGKRELTNKKAEDAAKQGAQTLLNWFKHNDEFLSGAITHMVPDEQTGLTDPRIGDKLLVDGIDGFFYVEGVSHTWMYGGALKSDLSVTRGFNRGKPITLTDRIFRRNRLT